MYYKYYLIILSTIFFFVTFTTSSSNIALPCLGCHAKQDNVIPNINGLNSDYFIKAFTAYKKNERDHYLMRIIAKGYSNKQIRLLAKYFEGLNED